jgi:hypothetical protein
MNAILPERMALPARRSCVPLAGNAANVGEVEDDLEKYEHLEQLAELFFAAKRHHSNAPAPTHG